MTENTKTKEQTVAKSAPKNIAVYLRIRPPLPQEKGHTFNNFKTHAEDRRCVTVSRKSGTKMTSKDYFFNEVFTPESTQKEVYGTFAKNAVDAAFDGQHGVLFVYGQTGSGKTYTISNESKKKLGVLQQAMQEMWTRIANDTKHDYSCSVSYTQLYNEILTDLLDNDKGKSRVRIQMGPEGRGDVDLVAEESGRSVERRVKDYKTTMAMFRLGTSRKEMAETSMNKNSSRSHTIFTFYVRKSPRMKNVKVGGEELESSPVALEGRLVLCDLAGSERVSKTKAEGKTLDEATHINSSLLVLGKVVAALTEKKSQHAPFRESKLTRILQYSLLGNGNTSIVVTISPSDDNTEESLSAILFGQRAIQIKQDALRHEVLDYKALYLQLMAELDAKNDGTLENALEDEKAVYEDRISALEDQIRMLKMEVEALEKENNALRSALPPSRVAALVGNGSGSFSPNASGVFSGSGSPRPGGAPPAAMWKTLILELKNMMEARDQRIKQMGDERTKLTQMLAEEKRTCFRLAEKMRAVALQYKQERTSLLSRVDQLTAELATVKGTDYLTSAGAAAPASPLSASQKVVLGGAGGGEVYDVDTLDKALAQIHELRTERLELLVYQAKADHAIRMLAVENEGLKTGRLSESNRMSESNRSAAGFRLSESMMAQDSKGASSPRGKPAALPETKPAAPAPVAAATAKTAPAAAK